MPAPTGAQTTFWYRWENEGFANPPTETDNDAKPFGAQATADTAEGSNEVIRVLEPSSAEAVEILKTVFAGSFSVTFTLTNPWWLASVLGAPSTTDNGDGTFTHEFTGGSRSMRIYQGNTAGGYTRVLYGCVVSEATISVQTPELVQVSLSGAYVGEDTDDTTPASQPSIQRAPLRFSEALLNVAGSKVSLAQNVEASLNQNASMVNALDSDESVDYYTGEIEPTLNFEQVRDDTTDTLETFYGSADGTEGADPSYDDAEVVFDSTLASNQLSLDLSATFPETYGTSSAEDPTDLTTGEVNRALKTLTASATNEVSTAP